MSVGRNVTACGLFLDLRSVCGCVDGLKDVVGIRPTDMSIIVSDGTIISAIQIQRGKSEALKNWSGVPSSRPEYAAKMASSSNAWAKTLSTMGVPVYDSESLESKIRNGGILVSIRCPDSTLAAAKEVLIQTGAQYFSFTRDMKIVAERNPVRMPERYTSLVAREWQPQRSAHV